MAAQMKDYAYSDNADVLRGKVNTGTPVLRGKGDNASIARITPDSPISSSERDKIFNNPEGYVPPGTRTIFDSMSDAINANKARKRSLEIGGRYDETGFRNKNMPSPVSGLSSGATNTVPSKLIGAQQEAGTSRFDKSKLTLGNNPYTGQVGMFKNGEMISNQDAATELGQKGKGQFLGKFSSPVGGVTDFTNLFTQDQKLFQAQMAAVKRGEGSGIFTGPADPGAGRYGHGSQMSSLQSRRDMLQSKVDLYNKNNPIVKGSSVGDIISNTVATQQMRDEIKHIDDTVFGKNDLANKIQQKLIEMQSGENEQNLRNKGASESQHIAGNYGLMQQDLQNKGTANAALINNTLGGKPSKFGDTKSDHVDKIRLELMKDQAKTLYDSQIESGKSHQEAVDVIKASFPGLQSPIDDDEKKVEGV